jgi:hypothetical protein
MIRLTNRNEIYMNEIVIHWNQMYSDVIEIKYDIILHKYCLQINGYFVRHRR